MRRLALTVMLVAAACGGGDDATVDAGIVGPALELPAVIALPYVEAGAGASMLDVSVGNPGTEDLGALTWAVDDPDFAIVAAPEAIAAGDTATLTLRWAGAPARAIAGATLTVDSELGPRTAEVWAVAGDPALGAASFEPVSGAGGVTIGQSAVVRMPTAPFPAPGGAWTDDRVHLFVPDGWRQRAAQDVVLHFHGHSTTIDATVPGHRYREHVYASGADVILAVPQGPVNAASGDFGKLDDPAGTAAFLDEVLIVLYRAGIVTRPALGDLTLTSHSGGYAAAAANLAAARQVDLFDSLYGFSSTYEDFVLDGGLLRSNYTTSGGTLDNNESLAAALDAVTWPGPRDLRDAAAVIYFTTASHGGSTRDDGAFGEQLRWGGRHGRRGPRAELRSAVATGGTATVTWLAPHDDDVIAWRVETGPDWSVAAEVDAGADRASFPLDAGAWVRVVPVVDGVADPQPSDVYRVDADAEVLVVDGFDRVVDGSWGGLAHDFAARVGDAAGTVHTVSAMGVIEDAFVLSTYDVVIWLVGDESSDDHPFTITEQAEIADYLDGGGRVILSGSEIGFDLGAPNTWLAQATGARYASDDAGTGSAQGSGPLASLPAFGFGGAAAPYAEDFPDTFTTTGGGVVVLQYATGGAAAVGIAGRGVIVGFPLEVIDDPAALAAVVAALLGFVE